LFTTKTQTTQRKFFTFNDAEMKRVVIIGGGITGLAAAHRTLELAAASGEQVDLTLIEASGRLGGIVQSDERDGFLLERGPDAFISEKPEALALARRLGIESRLIETNERDRRSFIVRQGRLLPVPEGFHLLAPSKFWPFIKSDIFSWTGKARMALEMFLPRRNQNGNASSNRASTANPLNDEDSDESLAQFVRRRLGREALERAAQPMVGGIYTADPEQLSLRATMPRFLEMEREHGSLIRALRKQNRSPTVREGSVVDQVSSSTVQASRAVSGTSGARYTLFLTFDRGMQVLTDTLAERISNFKFEISKLESEPVTGDAQPRVSIRVNTRVESLTQKIETDDAATSGATASAATWTIKTDRNETLIADAICLALPSYAAAHLLRDVDAELASELEAIPYASSATINLAYKREDIPHPLNGFGFVVPFIEKRTVMACTFSSVKFAGRAPQDHALLRAFVGGALQPELFDLDDAELLTRVREDLRELLGIERAPLFAEVARWQRSMPQYHVGHLARVKRIEQRLTSLPGFALAGNAYSGLGIPDCIRSGEAAAEKVWSLKSEVRLECINSSPQPTAAKEGVTDGNNQKV
jgi:protoporphyrinogen/coproporphyrinogen III oxidase